jgi:polyhydroxyalkanoate synthase
VPPSPIKFTPEQTIQELVDLNRKVLNGIETLGRIREEDIQVGVSAKEAVYREDKVILYHYTPLVEQRFPIPLLVVYALVNRPYMVDIQEDRSLIRKLLNLGIDVYLIDWGYPSRGDRWLTLEDYIDGYINNCVDFLSDRHGLDKINVLGICQGGTFSLCYASLYPEKVQKLITMVTPVDFHVQDGLLNRWSGCSVGAQSVDIDLMVDALGNIPGSFLNAGYLMLKPYLLGVQKYLDVIDLMDNETELLNFLRMEKWIFDSPDQAGEAFRQFMKDFYQGNKLIKGEVKIGNKNVDLRNIRMPVLNIYAEQDHLVPPASSLALEKFCANRDYTVLSFPTGHIGMYVSGKVQRDLPPAIATWLRR